jgi:hypothetical protein
MCVVLVVVALLVLFLSRFSASSALVFIYHTFRLFGDFRVNNLAYLGATAVTHRGVTSRLIEKSLIIKTARPKSTVTLTFDPNG